MREFFDRLNMRLAEFMQGRYGMDDLNKFLLITGIIILLITTFIPVPYVSLLSWVFLILVIMRAISTNHDRRERENEVYLKTVRAPKKFFKRLSMRWKNRKTTVYFKCKGCKAQLSVPKGKGKIKVVCPKCKTETYKTT